jgi:hypothetical protein
VKRIILCSYQTLYVLMFFYFGFIPSSQAQCLPNLGASSNFVLFTTAGAIGNTGTSFITGDIGTNIGAVTGFGSPTVVNGGTHIANNTTSQAITDLTAVYNQLYALTPTNTTHAAAFGGETLTSGIYSIGGAGSLAGTLVLDGQGNSNAIFVFKIGGAFTSGAASTITLVNGASATNVFWLADGAVSMGASTIISGTVIANGAISMGDGGILHGRLLSTTGAIAVYNLVSDSHGIEIADAVGGTVTSNQTSCTAFIPTDLILSGSIGSVSQWEKSTDAAFISPETIVATASTLTGATIGNLTTTTYFRAKLQSANCTVAYSSYVTITIGTSTTWNGNSWDNGIPTETSTAIISNNYAISSDISACTLRVTNAATVVIPSGNTVTLNNGLTIENGSSFTLNNNANLIQSGSTNMNSGSIRVKRTTSALKRLDYTLWSSPVSVQNILSFSPLTLSTRFYNYDSTANTFLSIAPANTTFETAKGYLIRMPNNHPVTATSWDGLFTGVPNNGNYTYALSAGDIDHRFNLIGNPYPSPIDAVKFVAANRQLGAEKIKGALYFWRKTNNANSPSYCSWSRAGGPTGTFVTNGESEVINLNGIIQTGQGFFVEAEANATEVNFTNSMRLANTIGQFFRTTETVSESNRIWLNVINSNGAFSQTAIAYVTDATQGLDAEIDGKFINDGATELYSLIAGEKLVIQGRPAPFDSNDIVPLGFKCSITGTYSISLDHFDGLFAEGQDVFLRDFLTGNIQNLKLGAYSFLSDAGTFDNRFEVVYTNLLGISQNIFAANKVLVYVNNDDLVINTGAVLMAEVKVFDIRGRLMVMKKAINASEMRLQIGIAEEVVLLKITSVDGAVVNIKTVW